MDISTSISVQVNEQLSPVWSTFWTISLKKQYTQLNSAHGMNITSEVVTLTVIALNCVAPVKIGWLFQLSPGVPYLQILVIFCHECYIESLYVS